MTTIRFKGDGRTTGLLWEMAIDAHLERAFQVSTFYPYSPDDAVTWEIRYPADPTCSRTFPKADQHNPHALYA